MLVETSNVRVKQNREREVGSLYTYYIDSSMAYHQGTNGHSIMVVDSDEY